MSSLGSKWSRTGTRFARSARTAALMSSFPQPDSESRLPEHAPHPLAGVAVVAVRSISVETWSGLSEGRIENRVAAAALTCGAENDVPDAWRYSFGPQLE